MWGECYRIDSGDDSNNEKYIQINYLVALDRSQLIMEHTTTNQKRAGATQGGIERWRDHRGAWGGGWKSIVLATIEWGVC
jgi:hypothetical protein